MHELASAESRSPSIVLPGTLARTQPSARIVNVRKHNARWYVRADCRDVLFSADSPDWFALETHPGAVAVKAGSGRTTWRVPLPNAVIYAKVADARGAVERIRFLLNDGALQREWRNLLDADARGVPVICGLAVGRRGGARPRVVMLSEEWHGGEGLMETWHRDVGCLSPLERRAASERFIVTVSRLFALAHDRGFLHRDAHPNNILVRTGMKDDLGAVFLDAPFARLLRRPATPRQGVPGLAQLDQYFHRCATRTERLRFVIKYVQHRREWGEAGASRSGRRHLLSAVRCARAAHAERLARTRDRRLRRDGPYFAALSLNDGWRVTVALRLERRHVFAETHVPDRTVEGWRAVLEALIRKLKGAAVARAIFTHDGFEVEFSRIRHLRTRLLALLIGSPHRMAFERCHRQRHRDVRNKLVLACGEHRRGGLIDATMLIRPATEAGNRGGRSRGNDAPTPIR